MVIDKFFLYSGVNRDGQLYTFDEAFGFAEGDSNVRFISMTEDEHSYIFAMQLMMHEVNLVKFQDFHDDFWDCNGKRATDREHHTLNDKMRGFNFCTSPDLMSYMYTSTGDLIWQKRQKELAHWSQKDRQIYWSGRFDF